MAQLLSVKSTKKMLSPSVQTIFCLYAVNAFKDILTIIVKLQKEQAKLWNLC